MPLFAKDSPPRRSSAREATWHFHVFSRKACLGRAGGARWSFYIFSRCRALQIKIFVREADQ
jgi:hypothetical protein